MWQRWHVFVVAVFYNAKTCLLPASFFTKSHWDWVKLMVPRESFLFFFRMATFTLVKLYHQVKIWDCLHESLDSCRKQPVHKCWHCGGMNNDFCLLRAQAYYSITLQNLLIRGRTLGGRLGQLSMWLVHKELLLSSCFLPTVKFAVF